MNGYKITIRETYQETYYIQADTKEEAEKLAKWEFGCGMGEDHELLFYNRDLETESVDEPEEEWLIADGGEG
jgi:hypothetical protein